MNKRLLVLASALVVSGSTVGLGVDAIASAQTPGATATSQTPTKKAKRHPRIRAQARLNQAVRDGTITADQKKAFAAELKILRSERKAALSKSSTPTERQAERTKLKGELQVWASTNNFPLSKIAPKLAGS